MTIVDLNRPGPAAGKGEMVRSNAGDAAASFAPVAPHWLRLQAAGLATPYQTFDWSRIWCESMAATEGFTPMLVSCRNARGLTVGLLPLGATRWAGLRVASFLGGKHSNFNMGVFDHESLAALTAPALLTLLRAAALEHRIDLYRFENQPFAWAGQPNPMALLPHRPSASSAWKLTLGPDGDATLRGLMSYERGKKLRRKERKLAELGAVRYLEAGSRAEAAQILEAFLAQKGAWFRQQGIADPFLDPSVRAFLRAGADPTGERPAPLSLFALMVGGRVASVLGGAVHAGRFAGMFSSYDSDPEIARSSPGDLLATHVIRTLCGRGFATFDLGVGDADYKKDYCPEEVKLFDSLVPMTAKGRAAAMGLSTALSMKAAAKRSPLASRAIGELRRLGAR